MVIDMSGSDQVSALYIVGEPTLKTCFINLPTAFWGLLGPQRDVKVNSYHCDIICLVKDRLRGPKRPQK